MTPVSILRDFLLTGFTLQLLVSTPWALQPEQILLVANRAVTDGIELARYYQQQREIPYSNLLLVKMTDQEGCSREEYRGKLLEPLRKALVARPEIRCLVLFYGLPLRVAAPELSHAEWRAREELRHRKKELDWQLRNQPEEADSEKLRTETEKLQQQIDNIGGKEQSAAVDSELALLKVDDYQLERWLPNPFFVGFQAAQKDLQLQKDQVLMVSRLDGPNPQIVRRLIDDSQQAEREGLRGQAYFDARWPLPKEKQLQGYALYDASLHKAAELVGKLSRLQVTLDQQEALLPDGSAPQAALYSGWYSLAQYVDAFDWQPGAVAYHIASGECTTLKKEGSQVWCKRLLEDGVAATIGPVAEPYVQGFPLPEVFFNYLLDGYYSLVESYYLSLPFLSWRMVLVGDPLYRPFRNRITEP